MYRSFQNEANPLPKLWIRISDSESKSVIPNRKIRVNPIPIHESDSADSSRIRFRGFGDSFLLADSFLLLGIGSWSFLLRIRILGFVPE
ncbi:hypothetical protein AVEN_154441-1 [Araneus ventricosus]|uniref:Uncharacterized protein n=1 Tax=Araneus ventricosus TaxID=182803 RepID=A0A4Y2JWL6_ARAVE|nr:hypothetical protein AVEN_154441-1 [Araneus ventricosus]